MKLPKGIPVWDGTLEQAKKIAVAHGTQHKSTDLIRFLKVRSSPKVLGLFYVDKECPPLKKGEKLKLTRFNAGIFYPAMNVCYCTPKEYLKILKKELKIPAGWSLKEVLFEKDPWPPHQIPIEDLRLPKKLLGDKSRAVCAKCAQVVPTTFKYGSYLIPGTNITVPKLLLGYCDVCQELVSIPHQSTDKIHKYLTKKASKAAS